jgi:hypothetical protein
MVVFIDFDGETSFRRSERGCFNFEQDVCCTTNQIMLLVIGVTFSAQDTYVCRRHSRAVDSGIQNVTRTWPAWLRKSKFEDRSSGRQSS